MPLSEAKKAGNKKWDDKNLKRMSLAINIDDYNKMMEYITNNEYPSKNGFINQAIKYAIENGMKKDD